MGIYMGVRKVWPFKCQNPDNGPFIYFLFFFFFKRGYIPGGAEKGGIRAHIRTISYIGSYPPGDQKLRKRSPYNASIKLSQTYIKY